MMNKVQYFVKRGYKFLAATLVATLVDTAVLWLLAHRVFQGYVGQVIVAPIISFECANFVNFIISYYMVWNDRVNQRSARSFWRHFLGYNVSCTGTFLLKMVVLMLLQSLTGWDVVVCNLLAICVSGVVTFTLNEFVVFRKKKEES